MHSQDQSKMVYPITGKIFDVVLDVDSREWFGIELTAGDLLMVPAKYAHGYMVLSESAVVQYVVDSPYNPNAEKVYKWNSYGIEWPLTINPIVSMKDENGT